MIGHHETARVQAIKKASLIVLTGFDVSYCFVDALSNEMLHHFAISLWDVPSY